MASYIGASAEQEDADPILMAFAAEATKGDPASPEARELVLRWQAHLVKFSRSCDEEKLRRLADLGLLLGEDLVPGGGHPLLCHDENAGAYPGTQSAADAGIIYVSGHAHRLLSYLEKSMPRRGVHYAR